MTLAIGQFPGNAIATPSKRRAAPASSKPTAHNGSGVPCSQYPLRPPLAPQASRNTYQTGTPRSKAALGAFDNAKGRSMQKRNALRRF